jgi:hypothetical protein
MTVRGESRSPQNGVPAPVWVVMSVVGVSLFPIGLVLAWGLYKQRTWAWHLSTGVLTLYLIGCTLLMAGTHEESGRLALAVPAYLFASIAYMGVMWRTGDSSKWLRWSIGFLVFAALAALTTLFGRSQTFSGAESAMAGAAAVAVAVALVFLYSVAARRWCRVRLGWTGPVLD